MWENFLGKQPIEIEEGMILRSSDGIYQHRMLGLEATSMAEQYSHAEIRNPQNKIIEQSYLTPPNPKNPELEFLLSKIGTRQQKLTNRLNSMLPEKPRVKHFLGAHPDLAVKGEKLIPLPWPQVLLIEEWPEGFYLFRLTAEGNYAGDTWHQTIAEAKHQAEYEYGELLAEWQAVPERARGVETVMGVAMERDK